jgi:hypothetical protein
MGMEIFGMHTTVLDLYPSESNHNVGSLAKVLRNLEDVPKYATRHIFPRTHASHLFDALLEGSKVCKSYLPLLEKNQL